MYIGDYGIPRTGEEIEPYIWVVLGLSITNNKQNWARGGDKKIVDYRLSFLEEKREKDLAIQKEEFLPSYANLHVCLEEEFVRIQICSYFVEGGITMKC